MNQPPYGIFQYCIFRHIYANHPNFVDEIGQHRNSLMMYQPDLLEHENFRDQLYYDPIADQDAINQQRQALQLPEPYMMRNVHPNAIINFDFQYFHRPRPRQTGMNANHNQKYYQKRKSGVNYNWDFDDSEPHLKVSFVKQNTHNNDQDEAFYITERGLWKSQKNTDVDDIMIGRQSVYTFENEEIRPNDIVLPLTDRAISRVHCKIIINEGFRKQEELQKDYLLFLKVCGLKTQNFWNRLPINVLQLIQAYARNVGQFYVQDLGSVQGTFIKIRNNREHIMEPLNSYFIGAETTFHVQAPIINCDQREYTKDLSEQDNINFLKYLLFLKSKGDDIKGLEPHEIEKMKSLQPIDKQYENCPERILKRPLIRVQLNNTPSQQQNLVYTFVGNLYTESVYKFGRNQDNDVIINQNTISRKQCRIKYCVINRKWFISDGEQLRESSNGTWMSLSNLQERKMEMQQERKESKKRVIEHNTEIKISESILKVEMVNFHKRYGKSQQKKIEKRKEFMKKMMLVIDPYQNLHQ